MPDKVAQLHEDLVALGWTSRTVAFGRQTWSIGTSDGGAHIDVHVEGDGIVGSFTLFAQHPGDDGEDAWDEELLELRVGPEGTGGLRVHRTEAEVVRALRRYAEILAATVER